MNFLSTSHYLSWLPDLNAAPIKYRNVTSENGGPISSISCREIILPSGRFFEAFAELSKQVSSLKTDDRKIYGRAHGTGTAKDRSVAVYSAISEALERWAWSESQSNGKLRSKIRLDVDSSTSGFAAFPGLGPQGARRRAFYEAVERWAIPKWWEKSLSHTPLATHKNGIQIEATIPGCQTVILWIRSDDFSAFGFSTAKNLEVAIAKAEVELGRNVDVIKFYRSEKAQNREPQDMNLNERRLIYFSQDGANLFEKRLAASQSRVSTPHICVDCEVIGPWSAYTHVWRVLFGHDVTPSNFDEDYFQF